MKRIITALALVSCGLCNTALAMNTKPKEHVWVNIRGKRLPERSIDAHEESSEAFKKQLEPISNHEIGKLDSLIKRRYRSWNFDINLETPSMSSNSSPCETLKEYTQYFAPHGKQSEPKIFNPDGTMSTNEYTLLFACLKELEPEVEKIYLVVDYRGATLIHLFALAKAKIEFPILKNLLRNHVIPGKMFDVLTLVDDRKMTPLHYAAKAGKTDVMIFLINRCPELRQADFVSMLDKSRKTALDLLLEFKIKAINSYLQSQQPACRWISVHQTNEAILNETKDELKMYDLPEEVVAPKTNVKAPFPIGLTPWEEVHCSFLLFPPPSEKAL